jgi:hypothetical protein
VKLGTPHIIVVTHGGAAQVRLFGACGTNQARINSAHKGMHRKMGAIIYRAPTALLSHCHRLTDAGLHQSAWFVASFVILPRISNELPRKKRYTEVSCFEG